MTICKHCNNQRNSDTYPCHHCGAPSEVADMGVQGSFQQAPPPPPPQYYPPPYPPVFVQPPKPKYHTAGFVLGILSICLPWYGFILGLIGLPLACISKRRSSIILNIIGLSLWIFIVVLIVFAFSSYFGGWAPWHWLW